MVDIKVRNKKNWTGNGFYVGRPSPLENPFKLINEKFRYIVIKQYGVMLKNAIQKHDFKIITALQNIEAHLIKHGKCNLICYCSPKSCHADIIKQVLLNKFHTNYWLVDEKSPTCDHCEYKIGIMGL